MKPGWQGAVAGLLAVVFAAGCECRPVLRSHWQDLGLQCNAQSDFASNGSDQVILESDEALENFIRRDCRRGEANLTMPVVDFSRQVVVVDVTQSPLEDGACVASRKVAQVQSCVGGVELLYDEVVDPDCTRRKLTGSVAVNREDVRGAFGTSR